jgi:hypothetical protein
MSAGPLWLACHALGPEKQSVARNVTGIALLPGILLSVSMRAGLPTCPRNIPNDKLDEGQWLRNKPVSRQAASSNY